jgi:tRNA(Ile)-lysidine synthase
VNARARRVRARFSAALTRGEPNGGGALVHGDGVVAAVSGGLDSCVLLHLLRFPDGAQALDLSVAHFDHAMRPSSVADARWLAGLCRAWGLPLHDGRADPVPRSENAARRARYAFLEDVRARVGAKLVLTAHHADDQAETVLFRVLRGTGLAGLAGLPERREPAIFRPLLDLWREDLEAYARSVGLSWRDDPSNENVGLARNALRRVILPEAERLVAPGARRALVRLGRLAAREEAAWASLLPGLLAPLAPERGEGSVSIHREALLRLHPAVQARVLRVLTGGLELTMDEAGTGRALAFARSGASGRRLELARGVELRRELDRLVISRPTAPPADRALPIPDAGPGEGEVVLGGRRLQVAWGREEPAGLARAEAFGAAELRFPLLVRSREPGDRIRLRGGTTKLKKLFLEARVPPREREAIPVVVDAAGEVLWVPGLARAFRPERASRDVGLRIGIG